MSDRLQSALVQAIGWPAPLLHFDTAVVDRWLWLRRRLPPTTGSRRLIDIGCGTGAFTIGAALRGYQALGLSWDERNQRVAASRAAMCKATRACFDVLDVRRIAARPDLVGVFDVAILCEVVEHILDDARLVRDAAACLKSGGRLLLTTPNAALRIAIAPSHNGPFSTVEDGGHVRKGYTESDLRRLCAQADLAVDAVSYCTGPVSQFVTWIHYNLSRRIHPLVGWAAIHPLRPLPIVLDPLLGKLSPWPWYSICLEAHKPEAGQRG